MKLLRVKATNYKNCCDDFTIDFVARSKKTSEDKEYELNEIDKGLYVYNTTAFIGKNASGKTSAIELLNCCYCILNEFSIEDEHVYYNHVKLELIFYYNQFIYKYSTYLDSNPILDNKVVFSKQHLYKKKYYKSKVNKIYDDEGFVELNNLTELPEDTSIVFFILKKKKTHAVYFDCNGKGMDTYSLLFKAMKTYNISNKVLGKVIQIFDEHLLGLEQLDDRRYKLIYKSKVQELSDHELIYLLSSGTTKGLLLYVYVVAALENGFDLLIDEIENHFHKTLVENMISLFKDKSVNKKGATLVFTTHYCELLDLFNRQDNLWIASADDKIELKNMYEFYNIRSELLKSKQFYDNTFETAVNYESLMALKKELME